MPNNQTILADNLNDLIGNPPGWLLRSGLTVLLIAVILLLVLASFIRYPDQITAYGEMTSKQPPIQHHAQIAGIIDSLFVATNDWVQEGDTLLYLKNPAAMEDAKVLLEFVSVWKKTALDGINQELFPSGLTVGAMQADYGALEIEFENLNRKLSSDKVTRKIAASRRELEASKQRLTIIKKQNQLAQQEATLGEKDFERTQWLFDQKLISVQEYDQKKAKLIQAEKQYLSSEAELIDGELKPYQLANDIEELQQKQKEEVKSLRIKVLERCNVLAVKLQEWQNNHLLTSKISGEVIIGADIVPQVEVNVGSSLMSVIPAKNSGRFIKGLLPVEGGGKVSVGDKALIKVAGYPYKEYGTLATVVNYISLLPSEDNEGKSAYEVYFELPEGALATNYGELIPYQPSTPVQVDIITLEKSLLARIFNQFLNLLKNT